MSTHTASWQPIVPLLPLIGAAAIGAIAFQGEPEVLFTRNVHLVLVPAALIGWWVAWRVARALERTPVTPLGQAKPGYVALRGTAQAMPGRPPLVSPSGRVCVWYHYHTGQTRHDGRYHTTDTVQPFLLVDDSGKCIVLPDGADITGAHNGGTERIIAPGDKIYVLGELRPVSADTMAMLRDVKPEAAAVGVTFGPDDTLETVRARGEQMLEEASAATRTSAPLALPVVCDPADRKPFVIDASGKDSDRSSWYGLLATANLAVLLVSAALLAYVLWSTVNR